LCGWLLPGPCREAPVAPLLRAICAAVVPLPYRFDASPFPFVVAFAPVEVHPVLVTVQWVSWAVAFVGLTPVVEGEFCEALPPPFDEAVEAFFCCPGAFAEFPGAELCVAVELWEAVAAAGAVVAAFPLPLPLPFAFPLPLPFPARADPVNATMPKTSANALVRLARRLVISFSPRYRTAVL